MSEWISVNKRLPEDGEEVLVVVREPECTPFVTALMYTEDMKKWEYFWSTKPVDFAQYVTEWQPLPDTPPSPSSGREGASE